MADYRLFFLGSDGAIEARHDFAALDDDVALQITAVIGDASADAHHGVMLWQGTRRIFETDKRNQADGGHSPALERVAAAALSAETQERVVECEEALLNSHWHLARSRALLEATTELRREFSARQTGRS